MNLFGARTHFSLGESLLSPAELVETAKARGYSSVAICDTMTISGMMELNKAAKEHELTPIIGCRLRVVYDLAYRKPGKSDLSKIKDNPEWFPKVFVKNEQGMKELMDLLTLANSESRFYFYPRLSLDDLLPVLANGNLEITTGDLFSVFHCNLADYNYASIIDSINSVLSDSKAILELCCIDTMLYSTIAKKALKFALEREYDVGHILLTYPTLYKNENEAGTRDVLSTITSNYKMKDPWRHVPYTRDMCIKKASELDSIFEKFCHKHDQSLSMKTKGEDRLVRACTYKWEKKEVSLPTMAEDERKAIMAEVSKGWKERITKEFMGYKPDESLLPVYKERLVYELGILNKMKFERYFLLVQDIIKWSKENGIMVGPGRGSDSGSLVSFLMGITDLDPIRFGLIFERFINPSRLDLPDADIDFMSTRRGDVIDYIVSRFGESRVAGISNYMTMATAASIRDCGRVYEIPTQDLSITKFIPKEHGKSFSLKTSLEQVPELQEFAMKYPDIWRHAEGLEGSMRSLGRHAAGVVIAGEDIAGSGRGVVERRQGASTMNWDKTTVEDWGLVKIDVLGLSTLDILRLTLENIQKHRGIDIDLTSIAIDDKETMKAFGRGDTDSVFQYESGGMKNILKQLAVGGDLVFDDLCATNALYRPGPLESGMVEDYILWKQTGQEPKYEHAKMQEVLKKTGGSMVYQEQIMELSKQVAGYSMAEADILRKIISKKKPEEMAKQRDKFIKGCFDNSGISEELAGAIFDKIDKFAGYSFNLSHSAAYALIGYWCQYLKTHYTAEYFAAQLTIADDEDKLKSAVTTAKKSGVTVLPPDINISTDRFEIGEDCNGKPVLYSAFQKLKGLSEKSAAAILAARAEVGKFKSKAHFEDSVNKRSCNSKVRVALDKVGAFVSVEQDQVAWDDESRLKDQIELLPGLIVRYVKPNRKTQVSDIAGRLQMACDEMRACGDCELAGTCVTPSHMSSTIRYMVITDSPTKEELRYQEIFNEKARKSLLGSKEEPGPLLASGLPIKGAYFTSVTKSKGEGKIAPTHIAACKRHLNAEIELIKPPVIVCLGGAAIRHFYPDVKGGWSELCGQVHYNKELDATIVFGINPQMMFFREEAHRMLIDVFKTVRGILIA